MWNIFRKSWNQKIILFSVLTWTKSENILFLWSEKSRNHTFYYFSVLTSVKSYFEEMIWFQKIISFEIRNNFKNMISKKWSQIFFQKYFLTSMKSYYFFKIWFRLKSDIFYRRHNILRTPGASKQSENSRLVLWPR